MFWSIWWVQYIIGPIFKIDALHAKMRKELTDHMLLHCPKASIWQLVFSLWWCDLCDALYCKRNIWVGMDQSWERNQKKAWRALPFAYFGHNGRKGTKCHLKILNNRIKQLNLLLWVLFLNVLECNIDDHSLTIIGFVDWLSPKQGEEACCLFSLLFACLLVPLIYIVCTLVCSFLRCC